jgi:hypothetical protein
MPFGVHVCIVANASVSFSKFAQVKPLNSLSSSDFEEFSNELYNSSPSFKSEGMVIIQMCG